MTTPGDVPLTTASGKPTSVLTLLGEMKQRWENVASAREQALIQEQWCLGRMGSRGPVLESALSTTVPRGTPLIRKNKLKNILLTWASRQSKDRTTAFAYPSDSDEQDVAVAEVANAILDYQRQLQDRDALMSRAALVCGMHGTAGLYTTWDYDAGPRKEREPILDNIGLPVRDPMTGEAIYRETSGSGDPYVELLTVFDFVTDGAKDVQKDGKWLLVRRLLDPDEARSALRLAQKEAEGRGESGPGNDDVSIDNVQGRNKNGPTREVVEAWEMWWRPSEHGRLTEGLFAVVISGKVVRATTYPYEHGKLPIAVWRCMDIDDEFYGCTWVEDAVPMQALLNHSLMVIAHRAEIAGQIRGLMTPGVKSKWGDEPDGMVEVADITEVQQGVKFVEVPEIPRDMFEMADRYEQGIADVAGISDVAASGDAAAGTKNARLVAYATQVDEQKGEHTSKNRDEAELAVDSMVLALWQQFVTKPRLVRVVGEDNAVAAEFFSGAEIRGVDLRLEVGPGAERTSAARGKSAEEKTMAGQVDPTTGAELTQTGLGSTVDQGQARGKVQALVQQALSGAPVQADLTIDPNVAITELRLVLGNLAAHGPKATMPVRALLQEYMEQRGQQGQPAAPAQMGPQGKTAPQPQQRDQLPEVPQ